MTIKYTITLTPTGSPSNWDMRSINQLLIKARNQALESEEKLIEKEMEKTGLGQAQEVITLIKNKL